MVGSFGRVVKLACGGAVLGLSLASVAAAGTTVFVNNRSVTTKGGGQMNVSFPDVCKTPILGVPVPIPYDKDIVATDDGASATKAVKVQTPTKGEVTTKLDEGLVLVDTDTIEPAVTNYETALTEMLARRPKPPRRCVGTKADAFWERYIEWSETTAGMVDMLRRFELAVAIKANALGPTKARAVLTTARNAAAAANDALQTSILDASKACALSARKVETPVPVNKSPSGPTAPKGTTPQPKPPTPIQ